MSSFEPFQNFLPKAVANYKLTRQARAALVCQHFRELAPSIIGEDSLKEIRPKFFRHGILTIAVPNSGWAQRVYVHRHDLLMKLNLNMEDEEVKDLRTVVEPNRPEPLSS